MILYLAFMALKVATHFSARSRPFTPFSISYKVEIVCDLKSGWSIFLTLDLLLLDSEFLTFFLGQYQRYCNPHQS
jgi:hypothetical protein